MNRLDGKVALISGGARGQGLSHGRIFAQEGARVLLGDVLDDEGLEAAETLRREGFDVEYMHLDVASEADWHAAVEVAESRWGELNVLVANAGIIGATDNADTLTQEGWERTIAVNQTGVWLGMKAAVPAMRKAGGGSIVAIASMQALVATPELFAYHATKGAVRLMVRTAALAYANDNIRVNCVCPGVIMTLMTTDSDEDVDAILAQVPLRRGADPAEVSWGVLYLASDEASYVTGTDLVIDGGYVAQ